MPGDGRWNIDWQLLQCNVGDGPVYYSFQGSNPNYIKMAILNTRYDHVDMRPVIPSLLQVRSMTDRLQPRRCTIHSCQTFGRESGLNPCQEDLLHG